MTPEEAEEYAAKIRQDREQLLMTKESAIKLLQAAGILKDDGSVHEYFEGVIVPKEVTT